MRKVIGLVQMSIAKKKLRKNKYLENRWFLDWSQQQKKRKFEAKTRSKGSSNLSVGAQTL